MQNTLPAVAHLACPKNTFPFRTWRIEVEHTGRVLLTGFMAASPTFRAEPGKEAAEFSCYETALRVATKLEADMNARLAEMNLEPACHLVVTEQAWEDTDSFSAWDALQRVDRTSVEVGRFEAAAMPGFMRRGGVK